MKLSNDAGDVNILMRLTIISRSPGPASCNVSYKTRNYTQKTTKGSVSANSIQKQTTMTSTSNSTFKSAEVDDAIEIVEVEEKHKVFITSIRCLPSFGLCSRRPVGVIQEGFRVYLPFLLNGHIYSKCFV